MAWWCACLTRLHACESISNRWVKQHWRGPIKVNNVEFSQFKSWTLLYFLRSAHSLSSTEVVLSGRNPQFFFDKLHSFVSQPSRLRSPLTFVCKLPKELLEINLDDHWTAPLITIIFFLLSWGINILHCEFSFLLLAGGRARTGNSTLTSSDIQLSQSAAHISLQHWRSLSYNRLHSTVISSTLIGAAGILQLTKK